MQAVMRGLPEDPMRSYCALRFTSGFLLIQFHQIHGAAALGGPGSGQWAPSQQLPAGEGLWVAQAQGLPRM